MQDFVIVTPKYTPSSNGIKSLHKICHTINQLGGRARLAFIDSDNPNVPAGQAVSLQAASGWVNPALNTPVLQEAERGWFGTAYVLYPETMLGNPFNAKKVIRYFGNREGYCMNGQMIGIGADDFLLAHSRATRADAHCILFNSEINPVFNRDGARPLADRSLNATYIGKGDLYGKAGILPNTLLIGRLWPVDQSQLALLLREIRVMFTWDSWSSINVEAILCGAVPCFLRYDPWTEQDIDSSELGYLPRIDRNKSDFDPAKFEQDRATLIQRIATLTASWDQRVKTFIDMVEQHFIQRGLQAA